MLLLTSGPGDGLFPGEYSVQATNRGAADVAIRTVVMFNVTGITPVASTGDVDSDTPGASAASTLGGNSSLWNTFILPETAGLTHGIFGLTLEAIAQDGTGEVLLFGWQDATVPTAAVTGDGLTATNASGAFTEADGLQNAKIIGLVTEEGAATTKRVWFNGLTGWGHDGN